MKHKISVFIIALLPFFLAPIILQAQTDSLKGYYLFKFGMSYNDALILLAEKNIKYDTSETLLGMLFNVTSITYSDKVELDFSYEYDIEVELGFSPFLGDKFVRANLDSELECLDLNSALYFGNNLVKLFENKYGPTSLIQNYFDSTVINVVINNNVRLKKYYWLLTDGFIMIRLSYLDFFVENNVNEYTKSYKQERMSKGYLDIDIMYVSDFWDEHLKIIENKRNMEEQLRKEENLKKF